MILYIKIAEIRGKPGLTICDDKGNKIYFASIDYSVLGLKIDVYDSNFKKKISKIRQHAFSRNKTYNIIFKNKSVKLILRVNDNNINISIKGCPLVFNGDVLKKNFNISHENELIMSHKCIYENCNNYFEANFFDKYYKNICLCIALCIDTFLSNNDKLYMKDLAIFAKNIFSDKKILNGIQENTLKKYINNYKKR